MTASTTSLDAIDRLAGLSPRERRAARGGQRQLTLSGFLDGCSRRMEVGDPMRPALTLFGAVLALMGIGLLVQASHAATTLPPHAFARHLLHEALFRLGGLALLLLAFRSGPRGLRAFVPALVVVSLALLAAVFLPGIGAPRNGSHRWVELFGFSFQPSELARVVLVLWTADRCVRLGTRVSRWREGTLPMLGIVFLFFGLILVETDLGGAMLLLICALSTMWVGGARALPMAATLVGVGGGAVLLLSRLVHYVRERVAVWFGSVSNDQVESTLEALRGAGLLGAGYGRGHLRNQGVPYLQSDYVFAQIGEELGLFGLLVVVLLFACVLWSSLRLVLSLAGRFEALCAFGLFLSVGLQAMLHMQVVAGLAPPKGTTLPFISAGGTSLFVSSIAVGLALGAARRHSRAT